jgi:hypothetical protein
MLCICIYKYLHYANVCICVMCIYQLIYEYLSVTRSDGPQLLGNCMCIYRFICGYVYSYVYDIYVYIFISIHMNILIYSYIQTASVYLGKMEKLIK